jgi:hypothetical protein
VRRIYGLETAEGGNYQDTERKRLNEGDSPLETTEREIHQGIEGK